MAKVYNIIYADPPWQYSKNADTQNTRDVEFHYDTMPTKDICKIPVRELAANNSILFMWATFPKLQDGLDVIKAWGFEYKTCAFVWVKKNKKAQTPFWGMGSWTRSNAEICLLATKGKPKRNRADIHQLIYAPIEVHSKKPNETRKHIISLCGDLPRIELFSRQAPMGWDYYGNGVKNNANLETQLFNE